MARIRISSIFFWISAGVLSSSSAIMRFLSPDSKLYCSQMSPSIVPYVQKEKRGRTC